MKIVLLDTETTGLLKPDNVPLGGQPYIIELYGVAINEEFEIISEINTFINPNRPITKEITRITGISDSDLVDAPTFDKVAEEISELINGADLFVAHNVQFDRAMIANEFKRIEAECPEPRNYLCTVERMKQELGYRIGLGALYNKFFQKAFKAHRAKSDVMALTRIFHKLIEDEVINLDFYKDGV